MFFLKKLIGALLMPMSLSLILLGIGALLLWFTQKQKPGKILMTIGTLLLFCCSFSPLSDQLLKPLESPYPPIENAARDYPDIKFIVVLGGGHTSEQRLPANTKLSNATLARLIEGVRLARQLPAAKLLVSGGKVYDTMSDAEIMAEVAERLGVAKENIVQEGDSKDTADEARIIQQMIGTEKFLLVTSASHMPRSMMLFSQLGMNPIAAPTEFLAPADQQFSPLRLLPSANALEKSERAVHELLGLLWAKLRGKT